MRSLFASLLDGLLIDRYNDWLEFDRRLQKLIDKGRARRIPALRKSDDEWYLDPESGEIYVYVRPDDHIMPQWEKIDPFAEPVDNHPNNNVSDVGLAVIPPGEIGPAAMKGFRYMVGLMLEQGGIMETIDTRLSGAAVDKSETWYRDLRTGVIYRLIEDEDGAGRWERVPPEEVKGTVQ